MRKEDNTIGKEMYQRAIDFLNHRFPTGWGGCAIMHTEDGQYLISIALETFNDSAGLCMETGAMLEAQRENLNITHSMCLTRNSEKEQPVILTACGTCLERLFYWGRDVKVAVTNPENTIQFHTLNELQPWHWSRAFAENRIEKDKED